MLQPHSCSATTQSSITIPIHTFTSKFIPLSRVSSIPTFSFTLQPFSIRCRHSHFYEPKPFPSSPQAQRYSPPPPPPPASVGALPPRVFVGHSIYKGKAALTVSPKSPEFQSLESGAFKISKEGSVLLQFAPAVGSRQYDWNRKQVFSLSVSELGTIISLGARESFEFFHDPNQGRSDEGKVRKVLKVEPLMDGSGHLFNLSVQNKLDNIDENIFIPITKAELAVLNSLFNFIMPYLLGWHAFGNSIKPDNSSKVNNANPIYGGDYEWNR
ncbi:hypothetical protein Lal_00031119 [Lupinus albus]|uniref:Putative transcription factor ssDNA-binding-TF family n=1 Tax=Lupinus albus TaxID=3870 RepID=A0A6A5LRA1_LUPAL|nr:putative transcription factor ssDNA-binding-TF family [Lupinus albus]KAF1863976.1 hypothetical protein Lal_00031119 [Lupinus albus]